MPSFSKQRHQEDGAKRNAGRGSVKLASSTKQHKSITFDPNQNKVRFITVPARRDNQKYWFTEFQRVVKKGLQFELEPDITSVVQVDCRMQLMSLGLLTTSKPTASPTDDMSTKTSPRGYVMVRREGVSSNPFAPPTFGPWLTIGSVGPNTLEKVRVMLPPGVYQLRCVSPSPIQVYSQAWDVEREMK